MMEYKGYVGKVEFDDEAGIFHGEVLDTRDVITFQGRSVAELKTAFQESIDDYLAFCNERGEEPDRPFSGQFVTRVPPELHRQVHLLQCTPFSVKCLKVICRTPLRQTKSLPVMHMKLGG